METLVSEKIAGYIETDSTEIVVVNYQGRRIMLGIGKRVSGNAAQKCPWRMLPMFSSCLVVTIGYKPVSHLYVRTSPERLLLHF